MESSLSSDIRNYTTDSKTKELHAKSEVEANRRRMWPGASVSENSDGGIVSSHGGGAESRVYSVGRINVSG